MRGVLLDPTTGRPVAHDHNRAAMAEALSRMPASARRYLDLAKQERCELRRHLNSLQGWEEVIDTSVMIADATSVTGTAEALIASDLLANLPAGYMETGRTVKLTARGKITTDASAGNITMRLRWGGLTGTLLVASANSALTNSITNGTFELEFLVTCRAYNNASTTGLTLYATGWFACSGQTKLLIPTTGPAEVTGLDGTVAKALSATAQMDNTGNTFVCQQYFIESMN